MRIQIIFIYAFATLILAGWLVPEQPQEKRDFVTLTPDRWECTARMPDNSCSEYGLRDFPCFDIKDKQCILPSPFKNKDKV